MNLLSGFSVRATQSILLQVISASELVLPDFEDATGDEQAEPF